MSSVTNSRFRSYEDAYEKDSCQASCKTYLKEELLGTNSESLFAGGLEILPALLTEITRNEMISTNLLLADISHECINFIALFNEPCEDA